VRLNTDLAGDAEAVQSTRTSSQVEVKTPWDEIDDVFYEARGASWALVQFMKAVELDFEPVLQKKNALISLRQIIRELEATQDPMWSPIILNGSGFGIFANHSLVMASYISRANAAVIDLRSLLSQGGLRRHAGESRYVGPRHPFQSASMVHGKPEGFPL
jgi:hypothetical protein